MDFASFVVFMITGAVVGSFLGWLLMRRLWRQEAAEQRGWFAVAVASLYAIFMGSR